jgi:(p)ppGpp synthase/HD superfamily hydrolase
MTIADRAKQIALGAHAGQFRRDGVTPYATHPERVAARVSGHLAAEAVAWLHDVLEDSSESEDSLAEAGIPRIVINAVSLLTKKRATPYEEYLLAVRSNELARKVKIQDILDNLTDSPTERQIVKYAKGLLILHDKNPKAS